MSPTTRTAKGYWHVKIRLSEVVLSLNELLRWRSELHPDAVALVDEYGDQLTYAELQQQIERCALGWNAVGVTRGDVVGVLDTNSTSFVVHVFGLARLQAIPALLNWRLTPAEHGPLFDLVQPVAIVSGQKLIDQLPSNLPPIRIALHPDQECPPTWVPDATESVDGNLPPPPQPSDVFAIGFSSGTTGRAKGIPLRHEALARSALIDSAENAGMFVGARHIMAAPMFHLAGLSNSLMGLANGAELHLRAGFNPQSILEDIEQVGAVYLTAVPAMFHAMVEAVRTRVDAPDLSSMREMSYGASPIAPELLREVEALFPGVRLRQFYGMTEVAGALTTLSPADHEPSSPHRQSAGRVNPGFQVRLVDRQGKDVVDGQPGEILAKGPSVLHHYWEDSEATKEAIVDGWFQTGDIAVRSEGYLTIMDRAKDMVVTGGENVYPAEVEALLYEVPGVTDVAVIGVPDEQFGERVHAVMVTQPDAAVNLEMIMEFCRGRLAGYKLPRSMEVVAELPRNPTGKILKRQLRSRHWEGHIKQV